MKQAKEMDMGVLCEIDALQADLASYAEGLVSALDNLYHTPKVTEFILRGILEDMGLDG